MAQRRIVWSALAELDFKATLAFYNNKDGNNTYSKKLASLVFTTINKLKRNNFLGKPTSVENVLVLSSDQITLLYQVRDEEVCILVCYDPDINSDDLYAWS